MMTTPHSSNGLFLSILSASLLVGSWWIPGTLWGALLGWFACISLVLAVKSGRASLTSLFLGSLVAQIGGFYWLRNTIGDFGGFGPLGSSAVFALFAIGSSVQYIFFGYLERHLPKLLDHLSLRIALSWVTSEVISIRIFPWQFGHTQLGFTQFIQVADIGGTIFLSFLMFFLSDLLVSAFLNRGRVLSLSLAAVATFSLVVGYGVRQINYFDSLNPPSRDIALIQGNIPILLKHDKAAFQKNREKYLALTSQIIEPGRLVIWPETAIMDFILQATKNVQDDKRLPKIYGSPLLIGAMTYDLERRFYNSALPIYEDGDLGKPYNKIILMPFGEFTPFGETFPILREMNSGIMDFTPGKGVELIHYPASSPPNDSPMQLAPLICYEDIIPSLAREATRRGAQILVNLTNDLWFGETVAPYQHHLIAAFRAVENRRYLIRSTNSGLTAIVDEVGRTASQLAPFKEGTLLARVDLLSYKSIYAEYFGDTPWVILSILSGAFVVVRRMFKRDGVPTK